MGIKNYARNVLNMLCGYYGYEIVESKKLYEWQKNAEIHLDTNSSSLPQNAAEYLNISNPRLKELQERYAVFNNDVTNPLWWNDTYVNPTNVLYFRGHTPYVWQKTKNNFNEMSFALTTYYIRSTDELSLMEKLEEDIYFGVNVFSANGKLVSRDLLDSISQIYFLERHLGISTRKNLSILDIGAGYGRLAHRMISALPNMSEYICTDAYPISTFVSEYYLKFRNLGDKGKVVPLDEIDITLNDRSVDIAVNIHSFPECSINAIAWWLSILKKHCIKYLMIVPNYPVLKTMDGVDFTHIIETHGYRLIAKEPRYSDPIVQKHGLMPEYYYLFELGALKRVDG
jgi:hypothetical protein